jgi:hypothetical protein
VPDAMTTVVLPPQVTQVLVRGTSWDSTFPYVDGYAVPGDPTEQTSPLPWTGIDELIVVFSEDVAIQEDGLRLYGVNSADYVGSFDYDWRCQT